ncbi:MBL fold metallo-hydrolase [Massilia sp. TS11]|uniref:MBL fold metallo-hydrolase n=1 Tax=Massilia sp. TS11 TaxID=2908003 RepID=UPI001EDB3E51|nr:MBL fold metallo-hydrolase [Massilia sp. TS11]MCG2584824.1 MBL fold metallo-hydrolase [Massilia sp. TS11]
MSRPILSAVLALACLPALAQTDFSKVQIKTVPITANSWMLVGAGGNIGVFAGPDGVFLIDDQYAPLSAKIKAAVAALSDKPIRFILNTHVHGDHTGGNSDFARDGATIVAHENVRQRLLAKPDTAAAAPVLSFSQDLDFHLNGDTLAVRHVAPAHTDGDSVVWFKRANVVHMGDLFFNGLYPFIDTSVGGRPDGVLAAVDAVLAQCDEQTRIIPGHGPLASKADLAAYRDMLATILGRVKALRGQPLAAVLAAKPTADYDAKWGNGFMKPAAFTESLWKAYQ